MATMLICQNCGSASRQRHGEPSERWLRAGAALMVALPCALAAGPVFSRSQTTAVVLLVTAFATGLVGLIIAMQRPRCPYCGHRTLRQLIVPRN